MPSSPSQKPEEPSGLLKILTSVFSGVLFGLFLSKLRTPIEEGGQSLSPEDIPRAENKSGQVDPSLFTQVNRTPENHEYTERRKRHTPRWKQIAEGAVAVGTIGLLIMNILSFFLTKQTVTDFESVQRANLILQPFEATWGDGPNDPIKVSCSILNVGQTTALKMNVSTGGGVGGRIPLNGDGNRILPPINVNGVPNPSDTGPSLGPNKSMDCNWTKTFTEADRDFISHVRGGETAFYFTIEVSYTDVFKTSWVVDDCLIYWTKRPESGKGYFAHCDMIQVGQTQ